MLIGVFDSGIGGLTVLRALRAAWPGHSTFYLGDTARVPYGTKSPATVIRYARQNAQFLLEQGIELLVVACNTASAFAVEELISMLPVPVIGVIEPGAAAVAEHFSKRKMPHVSSTPVVGVIGTGATISSGAYERALRQMLPEAKILTRACPLLVPLVEEGWEDSPIARATAEIYLCDWLDQSENPSFNGGGLPNIIVLGCTHYPVLKPMLASLFGPKVIMIDSAESTARALAPYLASAKQEINPEHRLVVTDGAPGFSVIAARLLGEPQPRLEVADLVSVLYQ